jgi:hypothetical protein
MSIVEEYAETEEDFPEEDLETEDPQPVKRRVVGRRPRQHVYIPQQREWDIPTQPIPYRITPQQRMPPMVQHQPQITPMEQARREAEVEILKQQMLGQYYGPPQPSRRSLSQKLLSVANNAAFGDTTPRVQKVVATNNIAKNMNNYIQKNTPVVIKKKKSR